MDEEKTEINLELKRICYCLVKNLRSEKFDLNSDKAQDILAEHLAHFFLAQETSIKFTSEYSYQNFYENSIKVLEASLENFVTTNSKSAGRVHKLLKTLPCGDVEVELKHILIYNRF